jgi:hypothetical protein
VNPSHRIRELSRLTVALCTLCSISGCKDDNSFARDKMPVPTKARPIGYDDVDTGVRPVLEEDGSKEAEPAKAAKIDPKKPPAFTEADIKELRDRLPVLEGELVLEALGVVANSRVATLTVCLHKPLTAATSQVISAYKKTWQDIRVTTPPNNKKHRRLSANDKRFRMTAAIVGGSTIGCPAPETHTKVSFRFQERSAPALPNSALKLEAIAPVKDAAGKDAPQKDAPAGRAPVKEAPAKDTPMKKAAPEWEPAAARRGRGNVSPPPAPQD